MNTIDKVFIKYKAHALQGLLANPNLEKMDLKTSLKILEASTAIAELFAESDEPYIDQDKDPADPFPFRHDRS